jgi:hypothetical protein
LLTADLVEVRRRGDRILLPPLGPEERRRAHELGSAYLEIAAAHVDRPLGELREAWGAIPTTARERKLSRGLQKLILDRAELEEATPLPPPALRAEVFGAAAEARRALGPHEHFDREALVVAAAARHGLTPEALAAALYADLPEAHVLRRLDWPGPRALVHAYDEGRAQAVLLRAVRVEARLHDPSPAVFRQLFRRLKFLQLLHRITPLPAGRKAIGSAPGYLIELDGPYSLFDQVTRYGLKLALALPSLVACASYHLEAELRWGKERKPMRLVLTGGAAEPSPGEPAADGSAAADRFAHLPEEVRTLAAQVDGLAGPWRAEPAATILDLPGVGLCVPDLDLVRAQDGARVHVEVMGFWSRDAVWRRIELLQAGLAAPLVVAVSRHLRVSEAALPDALPGALYVYARTPSARALVDRAESVAARALAR